MIFVRHRTPVWLGVLCVTVALAGCAPLTSPVRTSEASTSTPESTTPTPTPSAPMSTKPADWVITFDGVGPLTLGGSLAAELPATAPAYEVAAADDCPNPTTSILKAESNPTIWLQSTGEGSDEIGLIAIGGDVPDDARMSGSPRTEKGVKVGSSLNELLAAYPTGTREGTPESPPFRFLVKGADASQEDRYLVFTIDKDVVQTILVQTHPGVVHEFCG